MTDAPQMSLFVKQMNGEILTIPFSAHDTVSSIYSLVHLSHKTYPLTSLRLLQYDDDTLEYTPLHTLTHHMMIYLFIEDKEIHISFSSSHHAIVGHANDALPPPFMEGESFDIFTAYISVSDNPVHTLTFATNSSVYYHINDLQFQLTHEERQLGYQEMILIDESIPAADSPADLLEHLDDIHLIADKLHTAWLDHLSEYSTSYTE